MGTAILIKRELLEKGLQLLHEVLKDASIKEDLRLELANWRTDIQWELDEIDNA